MTRRLTCWLRGHVPGKPESRGVIIWFTRCTRCDKGLMMNDYYPGFVIPLSERHYGEARLVMDEFEAGLLAAEMEEAKRG